MREILFRGKRIDNGEWVYGLPVPVEINTYPTSRIVMVTKWAFDELDAWDFDFEEVIPETVGQYTGYKDKNGQKIFEGDIMLNKWCVVEFCCGSFCINGDSPLSLWVSEEIIGNIHDNPEGVQ